jgi:proline dehydrogenase
MIRDTVQRNFYFVARRFVAGDNIGDAIEAVRALNSEGMSATLDFLGEDVHVPEAARRTREVYEEILDAIAQSGVDSNVSVKLTAMGLLFDEEFALDNLVAILERAAQNSDPFVRIDMEGSAVVEATLRVFRQAFAAHRNVGPVLQSYL